MSDLLVNNIINREIVNDDIFGDFENGDGLNLSNLIMGYV